MEDSVASPSTERMDSSDPDDIDVFPHRNVTTPIRQYKITKSKNEKVNHKSCKDFSGGLETFSSDNPQLDAPSLDKESTFYEPKEHTWLDDDETEGLVRKVISNENKAELKLNDFEHKRRNVELEDDISSTNISLNMHGTDYDINPQGELVEVKIEEIEIDDSYAVEDGVEIFIKDECESVNDIGTHCPGGNSKNDQPVSGLQNLVYEETPVTEISTSIKRGPGRPKKNLISSVISKGTRRLSKNEQPVSGLYNLVYEETPVTDISTTMKRGRGRPRKNVNSGVISQGTRRLKRLEAQSEGYEKTHSVRELKQHQERSKCRKPFKCKICNQPFALGNELREHIKNRVCTISQGKKEQDNTLTKCERCNKSFLGYKAFNRHQQTTRCGQGKPFKCNVCKDLFSLKTELEKHMGTHSPQVHLCVFCDESFNRAYKLKDHLFTHTGIPNYQCSVCHKEFESRQALITHRIKSHKNSKKCPHCPKKYSLKSSLFSHIKMTHTKKRYKCEQCGKMFANPSTLKYHAETHSQVRRYACEHCEWAFTTDKALRRHVARKHTKNRKYHACPECRKQFSEIGNMKRHYAMHTGVRNFPCDFCDKDFIQKVNLHKHISTHHPEMAEILDIKPPKPSTTKPKVIEKVECALCNKMICKVLLPDHLNRHADMKPYECSTCGKSYSSRMGLYQHSWTHVEEKFHCELCDFKSTYMYSLKQHARLHTGELPWECQFCGKQFSNMSNWKRHEKTCAPKYAEIETVSSDG